MFNVKCSIYLYRVHEVTFYAVEDDDGEEEGDEHEDGAIEEATPIEGATTHTAIFKGFEYRGKWVKGYQIFVFTRRCTQGVDDWCGIHEKLDAETYQLTKVTVFGGHR